MRRLLTALLLPLFAAACSSAPPAPTPDQKITALAGHLATVDPPAGWTLTRIRMNGRNGVIDAKLGTEARLEALSIAPGDRMPYFTHPCPGRGSPVWRVFGPGEDVFVAVDFKKGHRFIVSCRRAI